MNFFARPLIEWTCFGYGKGILKCTLFALKHFLSKISISLFIAKKATSYECLVSLVTVAICKSTQKSQFLLSQAFKWKKIMFFVITEMPLKTFVMVSKKLPDHFKLSPAWYVKVMYYKKAKTELQKKSIYV